MTEVNPSAASDSPPEASAGTEGAGNAEAFIAEETVTEAPDGSVLPEASEPVGIGEQLPPEEGSPTASERLADAAEAAEEVVRNAAHFVASAAEEIKPATRKELWVMIVVGALLFALGFLIGWSASRKQIADNIEQIISEAFQSAVAGMGIPETTAPLPTEAGKEEVTKTDASAAPAAESTTAVSMTQGSFVIEIDEAKKVIIRQSP
ncbi:MAG: hypothetical protein LBR73_10185 [Oscillospiraceae bacterium]|jgi:hypothetical protein|nr:hypothetical protein [Oscillospiraceae bacterium]